MAPIKDWQVHRFFHLCNTMLTIWSNDTDSIEFVFNGKQKQIAIFIIGRRVEDKLEKWRDPLDEICDIQ